MKININNFVILKIKMKVLNKPVLKTIVHQKMFSAFKGLYSVVNRNSSEI